MSHWVQIQCLLQVLFLTSIGIISVVASLKESQEELASVFEPKQWLEFSDLLHSQFHTLLQSILIATLAAMMVFMPKPHDPGLHAGVQGSPLGLCSLFLGALLFTATTDHGLIDFSTAEQNKAFDTFQSLAMRQLSSNLIKAITFWLLLLHVLN